MLRTRWMTPLALCGLSLSAFGQRTRPAAEIDATSSNTANAASSLLPPGFQRTTLATGLEGPTSIVALPDGRLLVGELGGRIVVIQNGVLLAQSLIQIPVAPPFGDRGLLGLVAHPNFPASPYLYAYYTTAAPRNRVSRFTLSGNTASLASEFVVWENQGLAAFDHFGGGLDFLPDGTLLISTGDQFNSNHAQNLANEHGKVLRVRTDGTIPADNPFLSIPGAAPRIWARGLRNPFRISVDSLDGTVWIGDVGGNGPTAWEEVNQGLSGANYGWPQQEGETCSIANCSAYTLPSFNYEHEDHEYHYGDDQGSITVGPVYRANAFPIAYRGNVFVADYSNLWIRRLVFDANGQLIDDPVFLDAPNAGAPVDLAVAADGSLVYVSFGGTGAPLPGTVYKITYTVGGNQPPVAVVDANPRQGVQPLVVQFSSAGSFDPDSSTGGLGFLWDFGDTLTSTLASPQHTYVQPGVYNATLTLNDGAGGTTQADPISIAVGNPPTPLIASPAVGTTYRAGDLIGFTGKANDLEDGSLPPSGLKWLVRQIHAAHAHPFVGPLTGVASGSFSVPSSGHPPENTHFEIVLTATDSDGLPSSITRTLVPLTVPVVFDAWPTGIPVFVDGQAETTPRNYASLAGYQHVLEAQRSYNVSGLLWLFNFWDDQGARVHTWTAPDTGGYVRAIYAPGVKNTVVSTILSADRNAQWGPTTGQVFDDPASPQSLSFGRNAAGELQLGLEFPVRVPQGALIVSARVEFTAAATNSNSCIAKIWAYDVASAPPFSSGSSTALTAWATLSADDYRWPVLPFTAGQTSQTPNIAGVIQKVVDRPDWVLGNQLGLVFDGSSSGTATRSARNFAAGTPPKLTIVYAVIQDPAPLPTTQHP